MPHQVRDLVGQPIGDLLLPPAWRSKRGNIHTAFVQFITNVSAHHTAFNTTIRLCVLGRSFPSCSLELAPYGSLPPAVGQPAQRQLLWSQLWSPCNSHQFAGHRTEKCVTSNTKGKQSIAVCWVCILSAHGWQSGIWDVWHRHAVTPAPSKCKCKAPKHRIGHHWSKFTLLTTPPISPTFASQGTIYHMQEGQVKPPCPGTKVCLGYPQGVVDRHPSVAGGN